LKIQGKWLWNRLNAMSIREIIHRSARLVRYIFDLVLYRLGSVSPINVNLQPARQSLFESINPDDHRDAETSLENLSIFRSFWLDNKIQLFDAATHYDLGSTVQWLTDPKTKVISPLRFGRSIDYRDDQCVGEIKYLWELGRHQFLVPMAIRISLCNDDKVRAKLESHLSDWIDQNSIGMGIHWCSSLEIALRLISWSFIHSILQTGGMKNGIFDLNCNTELLKSHLYFQVKFVVKNYSRFSSANNHLIGELTGVWMTCNVFNLGAKGKRWGVSAFAQLEREIQLQTHDDGVNKEQAIHYHLWSLEYFWLAWTIAKRYDHTVSSVFEERIIGMFIFLNSMCASTEYPSQVGDSDGGVVSRFSPDISENPYRSLLEIISELLEDTSPVSPARADIYSKAFWYQRIIKKSDVCSLASAYRDTLSESRSKDAFESGGYYVFHGKDCRLLYKAGPFGYLSTGAHGHADALSVTLAIGREWWLVDPGTYTYHSSGEWRNYFRSTAAHNTLCVNKTSQSEIAGDFLWSQKTNVQVRCVDWNICSSPQTLSRVCASHLGYADQGVKHERTVSCDGVHSFELHDLMTFDEGLSQCDLQLAFHFHPDIYLQQLDTHRWLATRQHSEMSLTLELPVQFDWSVKNGSLNPIAGWYSETYGVKIPCNTLIGRVLLLERDCSENTLYRTTLVVRNLDRTAEVDGVEL